MFKIAVSYPNPELLHSKWVGLKLGTSKRRLQELTIKCAKMASCFGSIMLVVFVWVFLAKAINCRDLRDDASMFANRLANKIKENEKRGGNVHGHIAAVNDAHGLLDKRGSGEIPLTEEIEVTNEADGIYLEEGDIVPNAEDTKRNVILSRSKRWSTNQDVPFYISPELGHLRSKVYLAIDEIKSRTCVKFKEVPDSYRGDYIRLIKGKGCSSNVGRRGGGGQPLHLGNGCEYVGVILHEMLHALGIWHEQSRPDRDNYVEILWNNIAKGRENNFKKYSHGKLDALKLPYDTSSIMHYDRYLFSKSPNKPTIVARGRPWKELGGQLRGTLTDNDVREVNSLFDC